METKRLDQVANDMLGLLDDPARAEQREEEVATYGLFGLLGPPTPTVHSEDEADRTGSVADLSLSKTRGARARVRRMVRDEVPAAVLKAARKAAEGRVDPWI